MATSVHGIGNRGGLLFCFLWTCDSPYNEFIDNYTSYHYNFRRLTIIEYKGNPCSRIGTQRYRRGCGRVQGGPGVHFYCQPTNRYEMNRLLSRLNLIVVGIQFIEFGFHRWISTCQFLDGKVLCLVIRMFKLSP